MHPPGAALRVEFDPFDDLRQRRPPFLQIVGRPGLPSLEQLSGLRRSGRGKSLAAK